MSGTKQSTRLVITKDQLIELYVNQRLNSIQIAEQLGTTSATILRRLASFGIPVTSVRDVRRGFRATEETKRKISETRKSPERRDRITRVAMQALTVHPNKPEKVLLALLNQVAPIWKFVGDGEVIIGGKNPDYATTNGRALLCEMYGDFWHRNDDPRDRISWFKKFGFDTLIVWERELKHPEKVLARILAFTRGVFVPITENAQRLMVKVTADALRARNIFNAAELAQAIGQYPYIIYERRGGNSHDWHACWRVYQPGGKTDQNAHWSDHGNKTFNVTKQPEVREQLENAMAWARDIYGVADWEKSPFNSYHPKGSIVGVTRLGS